MRSILLASLRPSVVALALAALMLGACGSPPPRALGRCESGDAGTDGCIELGAGPDAAPVMDAVEIVHGPQGGWHFELGARFRESDDVDGLVVAYSVHRDDGATLATIRYAINARRLIAEPPYAVRAGDIVVLDVASGDEVIGTSVEIELHLQDETGATLASDVRTVFVVDALP